jgi:hypothetical protein
MRCCNSSISSSICETCHTCIYPTSIPGAECWQHARSQRGGDALFSCSFVVIVVVVVVVVVIVSEVHVASRPLLVVTNVVTVTILSPKHLTHSTPNVAYRIHYTVIQAPATLIFKAPLQPSDHNSYMHFSTLWISHWDAMHLVLLRTVFLTSLAKQ